MNDVASKSSGNLTDIHNTEINWSAFNMENYTHQEVFGYSVFPIGVQNAKQICEDCLPDLHFWNKQLVKLRPEF